MSAPRFRRTLLTLTLTFASALAAPSLARANSCTIAPTANATVGPRAATPTIPGLIADPVPFTITWRVGAQHDAECSNMTEGGGVSFVYAATPDESLIPDLITESHTDDSGTATYNESGSHLVAQLTGSCACGILGGPSQTVNTMDFVVPVTIITGFGGYYLVADPSMSHSFDTASAEATVPTGGPIRVVGPGWDASLTTGESVIEVVEYPDGTRATNVVGYDGSNHHVSGGFAMDVQRTQVGDVKFYAEFAGTRSNVLTLHVTNAVDTDAGTDAGTTGSDDAGTTGGDDAGDGTGSARAGCAAAPVRGQNQRDARGVFGIVAALALALTRRRVRSSRGA